jgi:hypothetical protein
MLRLTLRRHLVLCSCSSDAISSSVSHTGISMATVRRTSRAKLGCGEGQ